MFTHLYEDRKPAHKGFTMVELLVVMSIIGILIGMVIPVIGQARETARRMSCQSNLMQLGLALHAYESAYGVFPAGVVDTQKPIRSVPVGMHHNWILDIAIFADHPNLSRQVDRSIGVYDPRMEHLRQIDFPLVRCPSILNRWSSNYAGVYHSREAPIDETNDGLLMLNRRLRIREIPDGLSCTVILGEKLLDSKDLGWMSGTRATLRNAGSRPHRRAVTDPRESIVGGYAIHFSEQEMRGETSADELSIYQPAGFLETLAGAPVSPLEVGSFGSAHEGFHLALGDGKVTFVGMDIDPQLLQQLCSRKDGMPLIPLE